MGAACTSLQSCTKCIRWHNLVRVLWRCKIFLIGRQADIDPKVLCGTRPPPSGVHILVGSIQTSSVLGCKV